MKHPELRRCFIGFIAALGLALFGSSVFAQDFPTKPIRVIVPNNPGSLADLIPRVMSTEMAKSLGQSIVVENRPGAGQVIGFEYVAKRVPADGYTIVVTSVPILASLPYTVKDLKFDPMKDLPALIGVLETTLYLGSSSRFAWKTMQELVANARSNPGKLNYGANSAIVRLYAELLNQHFGTSITYIPYSGSAPLDQAVISGDVHFAFLGDLQVANMGDRIRVLALSGEKRKSQYPDAATFSELGLPLQSVLYSLHVPLGTPKAAFDKLYLAASRALEQAEVRASFAKVQSVTVNLPPDVTAKKVAEVSNLYAEVARKIGLKPE